MKLLAPPRATKAACGFCGVSSWVFTAHVHVCWMLRPQNRELARRSREGLAEGEFYRQKLRYRPRPTLDQADPHGVFMDAALNAYRDYVDGRGTFAAYRTALEAALAVAQREEKGF